MKVIQGLLIVAWVFSSGLACSRGDWVWVLCSLAMAAGSAVELCNTVAIDRLMKRGD